MGHQRHLLDNHGTIEGTNLIFKFLVCVIKSWWVHILLLVGLFSLLFLSKFILDCSFLWKLAQSKINFLFNSMITKKFWLIFKAFLVYAMSMLWKKWEIQGIETGRLNSSFFNLTILKRRERKVWPWPNTPQLFTLQYNISQCHRFNNEDFLNLEHLLLPKEMVFLWSFII